MALIPDPVRKNPWVRTLALFLFVVSLAFFAVWIRNILLPFFIAFIIAYILDPVVDWLELHFRLGRTVAIIVLLTFIILILLGFLYYLSNQFIEFAGEVGEIADNPPNVGKWIDKIVPETVQHYFEVQVTELKPQELFKSGLSFLRDHISGIADTFSHGSNYLWMLASRTFGAVGFLVNVGVALIVSIYLLRDFDLLIEKAHEFIPYRYRSRVVEVVEEIDELMRAFFRGHFIVCVIIGTLYGTGYELVGLEGGFLVGFLSGLMNIIPYLGPALGFMAALVMALYQFGVSWWILAVVAVYVAVQSFEGNFLTPKIVGEAVGLNPVAVIFALMVFGKILGFLGLLLAIPLAAITKVIINRLIEEYRSSEFFQET